ncbi:CinA family protein [Atopobiaceae bacterium 24-176]
MAVTWEDALSDEFQGAGAPTWDEVCELAGALVREASGAGRTIGFAESCTGGLASGAVTSVPGSSEVLLGSVVSYACSVKESVLGVSKATLAEVGAVSERCVCEMASGARARLGAQACVSISGIAGPSGAVAGKPVGTVWFAYDGPEGGRACVRHFTGGRSDVRLKAVSFALALHLSALMEG